MSTLLSNFLPYLDMVLFICLTIGGFFALRNGRQTQLAKFQEDTNKALKDRIDVLEGQIEDMKTQAIKQQHIIDTITSALRKQGMIVTVDGDLVPIGSKLSLNMA